MAEEEKPSLHVDTDWKKQAQEEKKRLAEEARARQSASPAGGADGGAAGAAPQQPGAGAGAGAGAAGAGAAAQGMRELPPASFATLVQSLATQVLFYLGELTPRGGEPMLNLDMAKHQIDTLGVLEEKTAGNLSDDEKRLLDAALYEVRMRYVSVASQYVGT